MDALQLALEVFNLFLDLFPLHEDVIELVFQFLVVVLDMLIGVFDIIRTSVSPQFVESQVVVSELALEVSDLIIQIFETSL